MLAAAFFLGRLAGAVWLDGAPDPITVQPGSEEKRKEHLTAISPRSL